MKVQGVRGAITVRENTEEEILKNTEILLLEILEKNKLGKEDIIQALFSLSPDLNASFPAKAARRLGWTEVPLLCFQEIPVPGALEKCIRVLLLVYSEEKIKHLYLKDAKKLRPDL